LERVCHDAGLATTHKRVLTSEGHRRADLEIRNIRVAGQIDLLVDVTVRHDFKGAGHHGPSQGQLRNPNHPDRILESAATDKIHKYRHLLTQPACGLFAGVHVYLGSHPRRVLAFALLHFQQTSRRLF
jgi:hypothetical protein